MGSFVVVAATVLTLMTSALAFGCFYYELRQDGPVPKWTAAAQSVLVGA